MPWGWKEEQTIHINMMMDAMTVSLCCSLPLKDSMRRKNGRTIRSGWCCGVRGGGKRDTCVYIQGMGKQEGEQRRTQTEEPYRSIAIMVVMSYCLDFKFAERGMRGEKMRGKGPNLGGKGRLFSPALCALVLFSFPCPAMVLEGRAQLLPVLDVTVTCHVHGRATRTKGAKEMNEE